MSEQTSETVTLRRTFGLREAITITAGTVIGVGLFTTGGNIVGQMGAAVILATFIAMVISVYPALLYGEMGASLPYAGGTYRYASLGIGRPFGFLAGWNFVISLVSVTAGESLAFSYYFKTMFAAFGVELPIDDALLACIVLIFFIITNVRGVQVTGRLQNGFMFFFWGVAVIWFLTMIPNVSLPNFVETPDFLSGMGAGGFIAAVAMIWWCFAGFETCCAMGEEIKYPHINIPRALILAPFIIFAVNALFQWFLVGLVPPEGLSAVAESSAPYAEAMMSAGILGFPLLLLAAGIAFGGDFSTMNASLAVPPRYLYTMARDGAFPKVFAKLHPRFQTPYVAICVLGIITVGLVATNSLIYISNLSLFADLFYYVIGIAAAFGLRKKMPDLKRPFKVPGLLIGAPISVIIYVIMMTQLVPEAIITGVAWCVIGLIIFACCRAKYKTAKSPILAAIETPDPSPEEKTKMDKEFKIWSVVTAIAVVIALALYIVPALL